MKIIFQRPFTKHIPILFLCLFNISSLSTEFSLADRKLFKILEQEQKFLSLSASPDFDSKEISRKAQELVAIYEAHIAENPKDTNALVLYGKFLSKVGQKSHAIGFFLEADSINPKIAVVKQQIGNFLVESNRPLDALPFFTAAIEIDPSIPDYHFHLGNFLHLFKEELSESEILGDKSIESFAQECFANAAEKLPTSFDYRLRFAQSFFDNPNADVRNALKVWEKIINDFASSLSQPEIDYIKLCKARILLELNQQEKATSLIKQVSTKSLANSKRVLLKSINEKSKVKEPKSTKINTQKTGHLRTLIHDPHIARLKMVTKKLREENLIKQLDADQITAKHDLNGKIRLIVNQNSQR